MNALKIELNIALVPDQALGDRLTNWSRDIAKHTKDTQVMLDQGEFRLSDAPHLTLYQVPIFANNLNKLGERLKNLAHNEKIYELIAANLTYNKGERSLEVGYENQKRLSDLQRNVIAAANDLRGDILLERDPARNEVAALWNAEGELGRNIRKFGYSEVGSLFRPHATLNWFGPETDFDIVREQNRRDYSQMSGAFPTLDIFILSSHGRCGQRIASYPLGQAR